MYKQAKTAETCPNKQFQPKSICFSATCQEKLSLFCLSLRIWKQWMLYWQPFCNVDITTSNSQRLFNGDVTTSNL